MYSLAGIDILYDKIIGNSTDNDTYFRNFYKFFKVLDKLDVGSNLDRVILGGVI